MSISNLINATELPISVQSITTGGVQKPSGFAESVKMTPAAAYISIDQTDISSRPAVGLHGEVRSVFVWSGDKSGKQESETDWSDSTASFGDDINLNKDTTCGQNLHVGGDLSISGQLELAQVITTGGMVKSSGFFERIKMHNASYISVDETDVSSRSAVGLNGNTVYVWSGDTAGNQETADWGVNTASFSDEIYLNKDTTCGENLHVVGDLSISGQLELANVNVPTVITSTISPAVTSVNFTSPVTMFGELKVGEGRPDFAGYIQSGSFILGPNGRQNATNPSSQTLGTYLRLNQGQVDNRQWLYMSVVGTQTGGILGYARLATDKAYFATSQHPTRVPKEYGTSHHGLLMSSSGSYMNTPTITEAHYHVELTHPANKRGVYGVLAPYDFPISNPTGDEGEQSYNGKFIPQKTSHDKIAFVSQAGEGQIWVCDENGSVANGDYLCPSSVPGMAMRQADDIKRSTTVFKSSMATDFRTTQTVEYPMYDLTGVSQEKVWNDTHDDFTYHYKQDDVAVPHYVRVFSDKYEVTKDENIVMSIPFDFSHYSEMVGKRFKATLVGGLYQM